MKIWIRLLLFLADESCPSTRCNTLQHAATCCNTLQHVALHSTRGSSCCHSGQMSHFLRHAATRCNTLQHAATHCSMLHCNTLHCNTLQHTPTQIKQLLLWAAQSCPSTHHNTLQYAAQQHAALQHTTTRCTAMHCNISPRRSSNSPLLGR